MASIDLKNLDKAPSVGRPGAGGYNVEEIQRKQEQQKQQEEMREGMLTQILTSEARVRLSRIAMVKPDKARHVEEAVINMARSGQIRGKIDEPQLIQILEQISGPAEDSKPKIVVARRPYEDDDDDLFNDDV